MDDDGLPCPQLLLAGVLAAMTAWACCASHPGGKRRCRQLARKIVSGLHVLRHHPQVTGTLHEVVSATLGRWNDMAGSSQVVRGSRRLPARQRAGLAGTRHSAA